MNDDIPPSSLVEPQYVSVDEAARLLGVKPHAVRKMLAKGLLRGVPPTEWRVALDSVEAMPTDRRGWRKGRARKTSELVQ